MPAPVLRPTAMNFGPLPMCNGLTRLEPRFLDDAATVEEVKAEIGGDVDAGAADIRRRDEADSDRRASPLVRADGAVEIDTTTLGVDETVDRILGLLG